MKKINKKALLLIIINAFAFIFLISGKVNASEVTSVTSPIELIDTLKSSTINTNVKLDNDIELKETDATCKYNISSDSVLDLNGHTITINRTIGNEAGINVFFQNDNCSLTIQDSVGGGTINGNLSTNWLMRFSNFKEDDICYEGCNVIINGGTFAGPNSRNPMMATTTSEKIGFIVNNGTFIINSNSGSVFANNAFNLQFIDMTVKGGISSGEFVISPDSTEISEIVDADSDIWVEGIRKYTDNPRTPIGAVSCHCSSETGIEIKPKNVYGEQSVTTFEELKQAIATPEVEKIVLDDRIDASEDLNIIINGNKKTIYLNGYDLTLIGESKIVANYYTNHDVELKDDGLSGGIIEATDDNTSRTRTIIEPINYTNGNINMVVNGVTVNATSEWIFSDTNYYHLTINNGYFQSLYALVNFNSSYESSLTLNRLTLRNYDENEITIKLARNKFLEYPLSTIIGSESKLIYIEGEEDLIEVPKTEKCGKAFSSSGTLNITPIKGLEIPKVIIPSQEYGYAKPEPTPIIIKNTTEDTISVYGAWVSDESYFKVLGNKQPDILSGQQDTSFSVRPEQDLEPGVYKTLVLVETMEGDRYRGKVEFEVTKAKPTLSLEILNWGYGGTSVKPIYSNDVQLKDGEELEYKIEYAQKIEGKSINELEFSETVPTHAGKYIVKYTTGETALFSSGTKTQEFEILPKEVIAQVSGCEENYTYTGSQLKPEVIVKITDGQEITLTKGEDYTVEYGENLNKGEGTLTVKSASTSNYVFEDVSRSFNILAKEIQESDIEITPKMGYTGQTLTPNVKVSVNGKVLVKDIDYTVAFEGQDGEPGQQIDITVEGKGNYTGTVLKHSDIIEKMNQGLSFATPTITKKYTDPKFTITATHNEGDGVISYKSSNTNVAKVNSTTGEITIVGVGNTEIIVIASETNLYKQTEAKYRLNVNKADYDINKIKFENMSFAYDGKAHSIAVSGLPSGVKVTYTNNGKINVGTYQVTASFTGDYAHYNVIPNKTAILTITNKSVVNTVVSGIKDKTYTGKKLTQALVIKDGNITLKEGVDYSVSYSSNKKIGTATITITGKGNYAGAITRTFKINPKGTSLKKLTAGSKRFTAIWKAQKTQTSGYELQYATNKAFTSGKKKVKIKKNKTTSETVKKLKAKKKYYVRIRTYKTVNGKKFYSGWSKVLKVKTKK